MIAETFVVITVSRGGKYKFLVMEIEFGGNGRLSMSLVGNVLF